MAERDGRQSKRKRLSIKSTPTPEGLVAELLSILESVTADGRISEEEVSQLRTWLGSYRNSEFPAIEFLSTTVNAILDDGVVTDTETNALYLAIEKVLPPDVRQSAAARRKAVELLDRERTKAEQQQKKNEESRAKKLDKPVVRSSFMVAGVMHEDRASVVERHVEPGTPVYLVREPENPKDSNAILVRLKAGYDIGYVPREDAAYLARFLDNYFLQSAAVTKVLQGRLAPIPVIEFALYDPQSTVVHALPASLLPAKAAASSGCGSLALCGCIALVVVYLIVGSRIPD